MVKPFIIQWPYVSNVDSEMLITPASFRYTSRPYLVTFSFSWDGDEKVTL